MDLYLGREGQQSGPFSEEKVREMLGDGEATLSDLCWHEGLAEWKTLGSVLGSIGAPALPRVASVASPALSPAATGEHPGFLLRAVAFAIDSVVTYALAMVASSAVIMAASQTSPDYSLDMTATASIAGIAASWLYFAWMESSPRQATFGKMACNFVVTDLEGRRLTFARASVRYLGLLLTWSLLGLGFLFCIFTARKQCLHDIVAGCVMIKGGPPRPAV